MTVDLRPLRVDVIIPALDEANSIAAVVQSIPRPPVRTIFVVDNGSADTTAAVARDAGATVVAEPRRGYGFACIAGARASAAREGDVLVFLDGDGSDDASAIPRLLGPIAAGEADLVVGARQSKRAPLPPQQVIGNRIASFWLRKRFGLAATDLGPFRAIRRDALERLAMRDTGYGWTVEMQIKAARSKLRYQELAVPVLPRLAGQSKISGTLGGSLGAACKILGLLLLYDLGLEGLR
jgi:glycosyltransferase involved in cell wall biosynthesis